MESIGMIIFGCMVFTAGIAILIHEYREKRQSRKTH